MQKSFSKSIRTHWRQTLSMLLVLLTVLGILPSTAFASDAVPTFAPTGEFEVNVAGATGWNGTCLPLPVYDLEADGVEIASVPSSDGAEPVSFSLHFSGLLCSVLPLLSTDSERIAGPRGEKTGFLRYRPGLVRTVRVSAGTYRPGPRRQCSVPAHPSRIPAGQSRFSARIPVRSAC